MVLRVSLAVLLFACSPGGESADPERSEIEIVPVRVGLVAVDARATPVVVLEEEEGTRWLPIWIGTAEARSIATKMEDRSSPRPNTHDLAGRLIERLDGEVVRVVVTEIKDGTYYAVLEIRARGQTVEIDSRPSDAIAIALRANAPILVSTDLFEHSGEQMEPGGLERSIHWFPRRDEKATGTSPATSRDNL